MTPTLRRALALALLCALIPGAGHASNTLWHDAPPAPKRARALTTDFLAPIAEAVLPAVVMLSVTGPMHHHDDPSRSHPKKSNGAAFLLTSEGLLLTNEHLVREAVSIRATLHDGRQMEAVVLGRDSATDVALLQIEGTGFPFLRLGDSQTLRVGDWVMTAGNPASMDFTVTAGVVSALHRRDVHPGSHLKYADFIQTDAAFNKGSSGGPLVNIHGAVVGMATAMKSTAQDIGYAIPTRRLKPLIERIHKGPIQRSWIGLQLESSRSAEPGVRVRKVLPDGPASQSEIAAGEIILSVNDIPVTHHEDIRWEVSLSPADRPITVRIRRGEAVKTIALIPRALPASHGAMSPHSDRGAEKSAPQRWGFALPESGQAEVIEIDAGGAADRAGLLPGDRIVRVGPDEVDDASATHKAIRASGSPLEIEVMRGEERLYLLLRPHP